MKINKHNLQTPQTRNISFEARIIYNRSKIMDCLAKDKKLTCRDYSVVSDLLDKIDTFKRMKEDSIVEIFPRVDSGQINLVGLVHDSSGKMKDVVNIKSVRKLVEEESFRTRYLNSIQTLIVNIEKTRVGIDKIVQAMLKTKNINRVLIGSKAMPITKRNAAICFEQYGFMQSFMACLEEGYNPTKRIVRLIKAIDKTPENSYIGALTKKKNKNVMSYFVVGANKKNSKEIQEKQVALSELFKVPLEDAFK